MLRRFHHLGFIFTALVFSACASSQRITLTKNPNAPAWMAEGSRIKNGSIFGIGVAMGIRNVALARTTAGNRGRAEVSKILSTYSASLMKDYQASTSAGTAGVSSEEQSVEQAIKTFSANLMQGTEVKEVWMDPTQNNAFFVLVELNLEKSRALAAKGLGNGMQKWVEENQARVLKEMESGTPPSPAAAPKSEVAPKSDDSNSSSAPAADAPAQETKVGGAAPDWKDGKCDNQTYICGVGHGPDRQSADLDSRAEIARIFKANIQAVATSFESAQKTISSQTGEKWQETQEVTRHSMVSTDKALTSSRIAQRWDDGKGTLFALALIERGPAARALRDQIEQQDGIIASKLGQALGASDNMRKLQYLKGAVAELAKRAAMNSDLRVIDRSGRGIPPPHDIGEITSMLDATSDAISIGISIIGAAAEDVQACLEERLTDKGYQVEANADEDGKSFSIKGDFDVLIHGKIKAEKRGVIAGSQVVNTRLTLKLINAKTNRVLKTFTASKKASRQTVEAAVSTAVVKLCKKNIGKIAKAIDKAFTR